VLLVPPLAALILVKDEEEEEEEGGGGGGDPTIIDQNPNSSSSNNDNLNLKRTSEEDDDAQASVDNSGSSNNDDDVNGTGGSIIQDQDVHVNLAMSDLMAYLQVVANNSEKLPITRRDDPDIVKGIMTDLSQEEYSRKSAAFIPADVRVIGGSFTKYGHVWDLPTSREFSCVDNTQEPGLSYGGACCNSMLKVLYDDIAVADNSSRNANGSNNFAGGTSSNNVQQQQQQLQQQQQQHLFDDDDDDEESLGTVPLARVNTFASVETMNTKAQGMSSSASTNISWSDLLLKMKNEMSGGNDYSSRTKYAQTPTLCTTRKMDLSEPFRLVPKNFDKMTNQKRSLFIGCNYQRSHSNKKSSRALPEKGSQLKASHDDIRSMKDYIVNVHGFPESDGLMTILMDDGDHDAPTFMNIVEAFKSLSETSQAGDVVFVHFSGHGGRVFDGPLDPETESYDECLVPSDYRCTGLIRDTLIFKTLLAPMRYGVTVTIIVDACDTGMQIDLPYSFSTTRSKSNSRPSSTRHDKNCRLTMNPEFSFVRFLKVVKTLYESSVFTQLGKGIGSALGNQQCVDEMSPPRGQNRRRSNKGQWQEQGGGMNAADNEVEPADSTNLDELNLVKVHTDEAFINSSSNIFQQLCQISNPKSTSKTNGSSSGGLWQQLICGGFMGDDELLDDMDADLDDDLETLEDFDHGRSSSKRRTSSGGKSKSKTKSKVPSSPSVRWKNV